MKPEEHWRQVQQHLAQQEWVQAGEVASAILQGSPKFHPALHLLGQMAHQSKRYEMAIRLYCHAILNAPNQANYRRDLADSLRTIGDLHAAIQQYQEALQLKPDDPDSHNNLGNIYYQLGDMVRAQEHLQLALAMAPNVPEAYNNLGNVLKNLGQLEQARDFYQQALKQRPSFAGAHYNLANVLQQLGQLETALSHYQQALILAPEFSAARINFASLLQERGEIEKAQKQLEFILKQNPTDGNRIRQMLILPPIYKNRSDLENWRNQLLQQLNQLEKQPLKLADPLKEVGMTAFYLPYQGHHDRKIQERIAHLFQPFLQEQTHRFYSLSRQNKIRIGFVSRYFNNHSVHHYYNRLIRQLPTDHFQTLLFAVPGSASDAMTHQLKSEVEVIYLLPNNLAAARKLIASQGLDILVYTDIGIEPFTYFLAFTRLANIQCVLAGHPITTGIPTIDYYISSDRMEPENADEHYSEKLVRLPGMPVDYPKPHLPPWKSREDLGLSTDKHLYVCPMALFKVHPDFDMALAAILEQDKKAEILFFKETQTLLHERLKARFQQTIPQFQRIRFLPWASVSDFLNILHHAEVVLDTFHFGGVNTALLALATGTPMLTWPSPLMRGRFCYGLYQQMEVIDAVANSQNHYPELAIKIAKDRERLKQEILSKNHILYNNREGIAYLIQFWSELME